MKLIQITIIFIALNCVASFTAEAQSKKYFFAVGADKHLVEEFNYAYSKNNLKENIKKDSIRAYLELYINFRLKVKEAKALGYDTTVLFKQEFKQYKTQLEDSYLSPKKEQEALIKEAYERNNWELRASHILITVPKGANQSADAMALKRINELRNRAVSGEDFFQLAKASSEDPSANQNGGDLGYFTVFQMMYPFESAAYNTLIGEVSEPVRTQFGYHIIKVVDKRPNEGKVQVAHIMIRSTVKNAKQFQVAAEQKAIRVDLLLKNGGDWNQLCKSYSDDQNSNEQNGLIKPFGRGQIVPEFEKVAFSLDSINSISEPVKTQFGWHIIKLVKKISLGNYEEERENLAKRIKRDGRSVMAKNEMLKALKVKNSFYKNEGAANQLLELPPSVIIQSKWQFDSLKLNDSTRLFAVGDVYISAGQFLSGFNLSSLRSGTNQKVEMGRRLSNYEDSLIISYEKAQLPNKYPEFPFLVNEYYDGILLFTIMEDLVWNQSMKDSAGLNAFYVNNKDKYASNLKDTTIFTSDNKSILDKLALNTPKQLKIDDLQALNSKLLKENNVSPLTLRIVPKNHEEWSKIISISNKIGNNKFARENKWYWVRKVEVINYSPLKEIKGKVISDYQSYLDKEWVASLRKKYPVKIKKKQLNKVYAHFKAID